MRCRLVLCFVLGASLAQPVTATVTTARISMDAQGNEISGESFAPALSADGRYVAYYSYTSDLVTNDTNGKSDVFVHDRVSGTTTRVSVASDGTQANGDSADPVLSADGRFVAFVSAASNLVPGDTNAADDVFVHDRQTGLTTRVSIAGDGAQANGGSAYPALSGDGRHVVFSSDANNLVPGDTNTATDVFVHDRNTGITARVSVATGGTQGNGDSSFPALAADGRHVAFASIASNLTSNDSNGRWDIFVHDRNSGTTLRVSLGENGVESNGDSFGPALSADGSYLAYFSSARNLVAGDANGEADVLVYERETATTTRVSRASDGRQGNGRSDSPAVSADGRYVAFWSQSDNLAPGHAGGPHVYWHDRASGTTERVSVSADGTAGNAASDSPALSADGRYVAFLSWASNLVSGDANGGADVFLRGPLHAGSTRATPGDLNADGRSDLLWREPGDGRIAAWLLNGHVLQHSGYLPTVPGTWSTAARGDFDGDGKADLIWREEATGRNAVWLLNGTVLAASGNLPGAGSSWSVVAAGDYDGDGKSDLVWRDSASGRNAVWFMNGTVLAGTAYLPTVGASTWSVAAAGDFDGDGKSDLLWRDSATGRNAIWLMNGALVKGSGYLPAVASSTWSVVASGDYDGDGKTDLLWRDSATGRNAVWLLNGTTLKASGNLPGVAGIAWAVVGGGDFDGDNKADLLWRETASGRNAIWYLNGTALKGTANLPNVAAPWTPVPAGVAVR